MAGRVFAFALVDDAHQHTATDLAEALRVSPAAISGAVRWLVGVGMLFREREPGLRSDLYRLNDDNVWGTILRGRMFLFDHWEKAIDAAMKVVEGGGPGARRLAETRDFYAFLAEEMADMLDRWDKRVSGDD
jgi:DNA-binding transcriptional regulator GbsR (MarR family)